jgi:hypothetical protein
MTSPVAIPLERTKHQLSPAVQMPTDSRTESVNIFNLVYELGGNKSNPATISIPIVKPQHAKLRDEEG